MSLILDRWSTGAMLMMVVMMAVAVDARENRRQVQINKQRRPPKRGRNICILCTTRTCIGSDECLLHCSIRCPPGYHDDKGNNSTGDNCPGKIGSTTTTPRSIVAATTTTTTTNITPIPTNTTTTTTTTTTNSNTISVSSGDISKIKVLIPQGDPAAHNPDTTTSTKNRLRCVKCVVDHCLSCPKAPRICKDCGVGFHLDKGGRSCVKDDSSGGGNTENAKKGGDNGGDDGDGADADFQVIAIAVFLGAVLCIAVSVGVIYRWRRRARARSVEVYGGCSINMITTERIPSSVRESQSHIYCNNVTAIEACENLQPVNIETPRKSSNRGQDNGSPAVNLSASEMKETKNLPSAPMPPNELASQVYDGLDLKTPESPQVYMPLDIDNEVNIYQNTNIAVYENVKPPTKKKEKPARKQQNQTNDLIQAKEKQSAKQQNLDFDEQEQQNGALYVNAAEIQNIIHNKNCSVTVNQPKESLAVPGKCGCDDNYDDEEFPSEASSNNQEYVLVPPSYDSVSGGNGNSGTRPLHESSKSQRGGDGGGGGGDGGACNDDDAQKSGPDSRSGKTGNPDSAGNAYTVVPEQKLNGCQGGEGGGGGEGDNDDVYEVADSGAPIYVSDSRSVNTVENGNRVSDGNVYTVVPEPKLKGGGGGGGGAVDDNFYEEADSGAPIYVSDSRSVNTGENGNRVSDGIVYTVVPGQKLKGGGGGGGGAVGDDFYEEADSGAPIYVNDEDYSMRESRIYSNPDLE